MRTLSIITLASALILGPVGLATAERPTIRDRASVQVPRVRAAYAPANRVERVRHQRTRSRGVVIDQRHQRISVERTVAQRISPASKVRVVTNPRAAIVRHEARNRAWQRHDERRRLEAERRDDVFARYDVDRRHRDRSWRSSRLRDWDGHRSIHYRVRPHVYHHKPYFRSHRAYLYKHHPSLRLHYRYFDGKHGFGIGLHSLHRLRDHRFHHYGHSKFRKFHKFHHHGGLHLHFRF